VTKSIEIIVSANGETKLETKGFTGADCRTASQALEQALGLRMQESLTTEFHQSSHTTKLEQRP
jgi:hypothetical protein